jgi:integrase
MSASPDPVHDISALITVARSFLGREVLFTVDAGDPEGAVTSKGVVHSVSAKQVRIMPVGGEIMNFGPGAKRGLVHVENANPLPPHSSERATVGSAQQTELMDMLRQLMQQQQRQIETQARQLEANLSLQREARSESVEQMLTMRSLLPVKHDTVTSHEESVPGTYTTVAQRRQFPALTLPGELSLREPPKAGGAFPSADRLALVSAYEAVVRRATKLLSATSATASPMERDTTVAEIYKIPGGPLAVAAALDTSDGSLLPQDAFYLALRYVAEEPTSTGGFGGGKPGTAMRDNVARATWAHRGPVTDATLRDFRNGAAFFFKEHPMVREQIPFYKALYISEKISNSMITHEKGEFESCLVKQMRGKRVVDKKSNNNNNNVSATPPHHIHSKDRTTVPSAEVPTKSLESPTRYQSDCTDRDTNTGAPKPHTTNTGLTTQRVYRTNADGRHGDSQRKAVNTPKVEVAEPQKRTRGQKHAAGGGSMDQPSSSIQDTSLDAATRDGALIPGWIIHLVLSAIVAARPKADFKVMYPDAIRTSSRGSPYGNVSKLLRPQRNILAPLHVKGNHWVLLIVNERMITVYDSLPAHTAGEAEGFALKLRTDVAELSSIFVKKATSPVQPTISNDCALWVMRNALTAISRHRRVSPIAGSQDFSRFFTRPWLKTHLPATVEAADKPETLAKLKEDVIDHILIKRQGEPSRNDSEATACPYKWDGITCGRSILPGNGQPCSLCKRICCTDHRQQRPRETWRCTDCRSNKTLKLKCAFDGCQISGGDVPASTAWHCIRCKNPYHQAHLHGESRNTFTCARCAPLPVPSTDFAHDLANFLSTDDFPQSPQELHQLTQQISLRPQAAVQLPDSVGPPLLVPPAVPPLDPSSVNEQDFQIGQGSPLLAASTAGQLINLLRRHLRNCDIHALALKGISMQTRRMQHSFLTLFSQLPNRFHGMSVARATLTLLDECRIDRNLSWVTMAQKVGIAAAAFSRLHQYTQRRVQPVTLSLDTEWKDATRAIRHYSALVTKTTQPAVTREHAVTAIDAARDDPPLQVLIILMWACAARPGDISQLEKQQLVVHEAQTGSHTKVSILFTRGKVLKVLDPYTIHTAVPETWAAILRVYQSQSMHKFLLHLPLKRDRDDLFRRGRELLRLSSPSYDLRAIRRGAAQTLARDGVPMSTILLFTRHTSLTTLRRYLGFGQAKSEEASAASRAASALWPIRC